MLVDIAEQEAVHTRLLNEALFDLASRTAAVTAKYYVSQRFGCALLTERSGTTRLSGTQFELRRQHRLVANGGWLPRIDVELRTTIEATLAPTVQECAKAGLEVRIVGGGKSDAGGRIAAPGAAGTSRLKIGEPFPGFDSDVQLKGKSLLKYHTDQYPERAALLASANPEEKAADPEEQAVWVEVSNGDLWPVPRLLLREVARSENLPPAARKRWNEMVKIDGLARQQLATGVRAMLGAAVAPLGQAISGQLLDVVGVTQHTVFSAEGRVRCGAAANGAGAAVALVQQSGKPPRYNHLQLLTEHGPAVFFPHNVPDGAAMLVVPVLLPGAAYGEAEKRTLAQTVGILNKWAQAQGRNLRFSLSDHVECPGASANDFRLAAEQVADLGQPAGGAAAGAPAQIPVAVCIMPPKEDIAATAAASLYKDAKNTFGKANIVTQFLVQLGSISVRPTDSNVSFKAQNVAAGLNCHFGGQAFVLMPGAVPPGTVYLCVDVTRTEGALAGSRQTVRLAWLLSIVLALNMRVAGLSLLFRWSDLVLFIAVG